MTELAGQTVSQIGLANVAGRLIVACVLSCIIGVEREVKNRPAGMRTYMLTALASALFAIIAIEISLTLTADDRIVADPIRLVEAITAGVAFLAAGTIITRRKEVSGLTTGAGMWMSGAIGLSAGLGLYLIAAMATAIALAILMILRVIERWLPRSDSGVEEKGPPNGRPR